jgi:hypothetical protein
MFPLLSFFFTQTTKEFYYYSISVVYTCVCLFRLLLNSLEYWLAVADDLVVSPSLSHDPYSDTDRDGIK